MPRIRKIIAHQLKLGADCQFLLQCQEGFRTGEEEGSKRTRKSPVRLRLESWDAKRQFSFGAKAHGRLTVTSFACKFNMGVLEYSQFLTPSVPHLDDQLLVVLWCEEGSGKEDSRRRVHIRYN
ncbi:hypothetical protein B0H16DRAFT_1454137 [Mycena metata]|uniref:Uncharacterized protein n=1 Tax=Mycena metata TaxID=1033252 RepID=A0AAD7JJR1_9AGAR|nr:hypothetical protein B0H16DRAFT_1454137 [Mycena metata]